MSATAAPRCRTCKDRGFRVNPYDCRDLTDCPDCPSEPESDDLVPFDRVTWKRKGYADWTGGEVMDVNGPLFVVVWHQWDEKAKKRTIVRRHCRPDQLVRETIPAGGLS